MSAPQPSRPGLRLTPRGRVVLAALGVLLVVAVALVFRSCAAPDPSRAPAPSTSSPAAARPSATAPTVTSAATMATTPATTLPSSATPRPTATTRSAAGGIPHSGVRGDGTWSAASLTIAPARTTPRVHRYAVKVEGGTGIAADAAAREIAGILDDPRGWIGEKDASFALVPDASAAEFTIYLASPPTVDRMCLPLRMLGTWSCRHGDDVILNSDRWTLMTPTYADLTAYRAYMVNHEVGHFLGHGHEECGAAGRNAPVMMHQSKGVGSCRPNPWPTLDGA
ncbi:DUF3152 domain-containing protein [Arsenicicoccus sp. oral taxon 190]|uniref:DUF3152 domain-containing protein n=1 Tax=Arsenicicoccus sp. oral taxon 190 TaxID=1658671 RepID=UPI000AC107E3|nr:DUF3152 domain-containing protein [Arsenicicoccus sp. oral taxon 190]